jgi:hypothetical protein
MRWAMNWASFLTHPSSADPRVYCHVSPRKYTPAPRYAATMHEPCSVVEHRDVHEAVINRESAGPDHRRRRQTATVGEDHLRALRIDRAPAQTDAPAACIARA